MPTIGTSFTSWGALPAYSSFMQYGFYYKTRDLDNTVPKGYIRIYLALYRNGGGNYPVTLNTSLTYASDHVIFSSSDSVYSLAGAYTNINGQTVVNDMPYNNGRGWGATKYYDAAHNYEQWIEGNVYNLAHIDYKYIGGTTINFTIQEDSSGGAASLFRSNSSDYYPRKTGSITIPNNIFNSYNISYLLSGGTFATAQNTIVSYSNGLIKKTNPTSARWNGYYTDGTLTTNTFYFFVENPTRNNYTFLGWDITIMDTNTHVYWLNGTGELTTNETELSVGTNVNNLYNLRNSTGTVIFTARWRPNGCVKIYQNNTWKNAVPYIYNNGWKLVVPYIYNSGWKICGS